MNIRVLFDEIDKDLAKLGKISRFYSDDDNITITTDYNTYKVNRSMLDGIMGDYGYEFYDYGDNGDKVMITYNKVSDSRRVKDGMDNDIIENLKNKVMRKVKDSNSNNVLYDLQNIAMSLYDGDIEEAIERAIDDGLIYYDDILALADRYGVIDYSQLITDFYDDLYNDLREYLEDNIDED